MNLFCPTCGRFLIESDSPNIGKLRCKCNNCKCHVTFVRDKAGNFGALQTANEGTESRFGVAHPPQRKAA